MSVTPFDSALFRGLFGDDEIARLFSDTAEIRAMMLVMGTLAKVQGRAGVIPEISGAFLHRAAMEVQVDPAGLAAATGQNGVTVPGLVTAFRGALNAPEHAPYLHWGATSQDVQDTALMLRLRQALMLIEARLGGALTALADLAEAHAETVQAARTYGQVATPSSFGALVASWGAPLIRAHDRLDRLREDCLCVSLSGAAGTGTMLGPDPDALRAELAQSLGLSDPGESWHASRDRIGEIAGWLTGVATAAGKMGEDLIRHTRSEVAEIRLEGAGGSSTMPQKQNPVGPSVLVALARHTVALDGAVRGAALHGEARDGAAWFAEWLALPQLVAAAAKSAALVEDLSRTITPDTQAMAEHAADPLGLIHAETLSFALARDMPRPEAQATVKTLAPPPCPTSSLARTPKRACRISLRQQRLAPRRRRPAPLPRPPAPPPPGSPRHTHRADPLPSLSSKYARRKAPKRRGGLKAPLGAFRATPEAAQT
jgi:3-carboxy-cis,cis-muconate cycloisomerase